MGELTGKVAIVTGASRGIGVGIAERLAAEGAAVAVTARSLNAHPHLPGTLQETVERIQSRGGKALAIQADLGSEGASSQIVAQTRDELGPVDILVHNAAACFYIPFLKLSQKRFRVTFEVNVFAAFELAQAVLPDMLEKGEGWIVNLSSDVAAIPEGPPFHEFQRSGYPLLYGCSKAALNRLTVGLSAEFYDSGITVNTLEPVAAVLTPGVEALGIDTTGVVVEPVEAMAEAALALCVADPKSLTGRIAKTTPLLEELGRPVRTLDGRALYTE